MSPSKIGRSKTEHMKEHYRIAAEVVERIRRGDEDVLRPKISGMAWMI